MDGTSSSVEILAEGALQKHSPKKLNVKRWQMRHFILTSASFSYFKKRGDATPLGVIDLTTVRNVTLKSEGVRGGDGRFMSPGKKAIFEVEVEGRVYSLAAESHDEARRWVQALRFAMSSASKAALMLSSPSNVSMAIYDPMDDEEEDSATKDTPTEYTLLQGERLLAKNERVLISQHSLSEGNWGQMHMTLYRFVFITKNHCESVPLSLVMRVEGAKHAQRGLIGYLLACKDFRTISLFFLNPEELESVSLLFKHILFPTTIRSLYAFHNKESFPLKFEIKGWPLYNIEKEAERQLLNNSRWRVTRVNENHALPHLPTRFIVPAAMTDEMLRQIGEAQQRWQRWMIIMCWNHSRSMARGCLLRCADSISAALADTNDKNTGSSKRQLSIIEHVLALYPDAQGFHVFNTTNRRRLVGGNQDTARAEVNGDTRTINFRSTNLMSSPAIEDSLIKLANLINTSDLSAFSSLSQADSDLSFKKVTNIWRETLDDTQWLKGVQQLLQETLVIVTLIMDGEPVLVQSVDGGEAVPQLVSLAQICLDPYFRTIEGFCFLIEKEWMACAHKWGQQQKAKYQPKQYSHIFLQFIDAVWQLWDISPSAFEFDASFLLFLMESVYSARFGSFLADKQRDRLKGKMLLSSNTVSIWSYIHANIKQFQHQIYSRADLKALISQPLLPQPDKVKLWNGYFLRWACASSYAQAQRTLQMQLKKDQTGGRSTAINLRKQTLHTVPSAVLDLPYVNHLDLSRNFISSLPFSLVTLLDLEHIDLSHNLLTTLPTYLVKSIPLLSRLSRLNLAHNQLPDISYLPAIDMPALTHLDVSRNMIQTVPAHFAHLTKLQYLDLSDNHIGTTGKNQDAVLCSLTSLTSLNLSGNTVLLVSAKLFSSLSMLEELSLCNCKLTKLPMGIAQATRLRILRISNNPNLLGLPSDLWKLTSLHELHARNCLGFAKDAIPTPEISAGTGILPQIAVNLARRKRSTVKMMPLSQDKLMTMAGVAALLPEELGQLTELRYLDFSGNGISGIPPFCFAKMNKLESLRLEGNALATFAIDLSGLSSLRELDLSHNVLNQIPPEVASLKQLSSLNLEGNSIPELPAQLSTLPLLTKLQVGPQNGCMRSPPQEIIALGSNSIMAYLSQLLYGQQPCHRMKLMFVGQENVGKTSLLGALKRRDKRKALIGARLRQSDNDTHTAPLSTDGININKWSMELSSMGPVTTQIELSAWDFAGQEIYYVTHRFFLSERSLYLVVFNTLNVDQSYIDYWLHSVSTAALKSPVIIVGTHAEDERCTEEYLDNLYSRLFNRYSERFPNLVAIHFVSCTTGRGMEHLQGLMQDVIAKQEHIGQPLPANYLELEKLLIAKAKERVPPILSWSEYESLARRLCMIEKEQDLLTATSLLHNLGSIVHFPDEKLKDVVILDPQWLMNVMSTVVSTKHNYCRNGVMAQSALPQIWKVPDYPPEVHPFILSLLERFELSFPIGPHAHKLGDYHQVLRLGSTATSDADAESDPLYLIPTLLPEFQPSLLNSLWPSTPDWQESIFGRTYKFDFIPKGFLGRLIIRLLSFPLAAHVYWRHGVLVQFGGEKVLLVLQPDLRQLTITVRTELRGEQMSNLCWLIFAAVDALVKEWYNLNPKILVPCAHCLSRSLTDSPFMFPLEKCQQAATTPGASLLLCPKGAESSETGLPKQVRLDHVAPDLAMVHLDKHKIEWSALVKDDDKPIAQGGFASVYKGFYRGEPVAIKEIKSVDVDEFGSIGLNLDAESRRLTFEEFRHEVWIMSGLAHPNLVGLRGFCLHPPCIVTELVEAGSLFDFLSSPEKSKILDWPLRLKIAKDIAKGCAFLHNTSPPMMHRDLKSPNILLADVSPNASVVAKLCDFGLSLSAEVTAGRKVDCPVWLAPEILEKKTYTEKADVYSLGVIFWELLTKQQYFGEVKFMALLEDLVKEGQRPPIPDSCIPSYKQLIEDCWASDPAQRPSTKEIVKRIEAIMAGVCPEAAKYDVDALTNFEARRAVELEERARWQDARKLRNKEKLRAMQMVSIRSIVPSEPKRQMISKTIKEMATAPCSKNDIIEFMEEFLKLRKEALEVMNEDFAEKEDMSEIKFQQEKAWIDRFLARLHEDKLVPTQATDPLAPISATTQEQSPDNLEESEKASLVPDQTEEEAANGIELKSAEQQESRPEEGKNEAISAQDLPDTVEPRELISQASELSRWPQGRVRSVGPMVLPPNKPSQRSRTSSGQGSEWRKSSREPRPESPLVRRSLIGQSSTTAASVECAEGSASPSSSPSSAAKDDASSSSDETMLGTITEDAKPTTASRSNGNSPNAGKNASPTGTPMSWTGVYPNKRPVTIAWSTSDDPEPLPMLLTSERKEPKKEKKTKGKEKKSKKDKKATKKEKDKKKQAKQAPPPPVGREHRSPTVAQMKNTLNSIEKDLDDVLAEFERELNS